jgi:hypothetical protein
MNCRVGGMRRHRMGRGIVGEGKGCMGHESGEKQGGGGYEGAWERRECSVRGGCGSGGRRGSGGRWCGSGE